MKEKTGKELLSPEVIALIQSKHFDEMTQEEQKTLADAQAKLQPHMNVYVNKIGGLIGKDLAYPRILLNLHSTVPCLDLTVMVDNPEENSETGIFIKKRLTLTEIEELHKSLGLYIKFLRYSNAYSAIQTLNLKYVGIEK